MADAGPGSDECFVTFLVADEHYALPAAEVSEIVTLPRLACLPQSPPALLGMANLRGAVMPVASARALLGRPGKPGTPSARAIILAGPTPVALAVDAVERIVTIPAAQIETAPAAITARPGERLHGVFANGAQKTTRILDIQPMLHAAFTPARTNATLSRRAVAAALQAETIEAQKRLISFSVANQLYAFPLEEVQEIIAPPQAMLCVTQTDPVVLGIIANRAVLLPILSLRGLLGLPAAALGWQAKIIVTQVAGLLVGLMADQVLAILHADPAAIQPAPPLLAARTGGETRIASIYRDKDGRSLVALLAAAKLFGEDIMQRLGQAAPPQTSQAARESQDTQQFLVFRLGEEEFGLPIAAVDEVAALPETVTQLPKTPKFLEGVINLRGEILPIIDQRRRFSLPPCSGETARRLVVMRSVRHRAGLIVDSVCGVLAAPQNAIAAAPDLAGEPVRLVHAVFNLPESGRLVLLLNPDELLSRAEQKLLDNFAPLPP